jgi:Holliday junction DNA helicase RuvB
VRDWAEVRGTGVVDDAAADSALAMLQVDDLGLDRLDRDILQAICVQFAGGPVGLSTLAIAVNEEPDTIEDVYEPYLLQQGLLQRTPRGRAATRRAYEHLGLEPPSSAALF